MDDLKPTAHEQLMAALEAADARTRTDRADRITWLSQHRMMPAIVMGRTETMRILTEAADAFVSGQFVASLVLATAFVEHALMEELQDLGHVQGCTFERAIQLAGQHQVFEPILVKRIDDLRLKRNPFTHLKKDGHVHSMGTRFRAGNVHPIQMIEDDAKEALQVMYEVFRATLKTIG